MTDDNKQLNSSLGRLDPVEPNADGADGVVIIATYNEMENLPLLVQQIHNQFPALHILVIDDNSPDNTGRWASQFAEANPWLSLISRSGKLGLGSATITGFRWALEKDFARILTMDADFSHAPDEMERLLDASLKQNSEKLNSYQNSNNSPRVTSSQNKRSVAGTIVIGSRYVAGGKIEGWPVGRRIASRLINGFARFWLRLDSQDNSGAFRCYDSHLLRNIDLKQITNQGYGYLEEILFLARRAGADVIEVPITFRDRTRGQSKISFRDAFSAIMTLSKLGFRLRLNPPATPQE